MGVEKKRMTLDFASGHREIDPLVAGRKQSELIRKDPGVREMLGGFVSRLFADYPHGLPSNSFFNILCNGDDAVLLSGIHRFASGHVTETEHEVHPIPIDYEHDPQDPAAPDFIGDITTATAEELERPVPEIYYLLRSGYEGDSDVALNDMDEVLALDRLISAEFDDNDDDWGAQFGGGTGAGIQL